MREQFYDNLVTALDDAGILGLCPNDDRDDILKSLASIPAQKFRNPVSVAWLLSSEPELIYVEDYRFKTGKRKGQAPDNVNHQRFYATLEAVAPIVRAYNETRKDQLEFFLYIPLKW